ncbi:MAG: hypothetical protein JZU65_19600 [Chlorobium sp.]|nr:hypothetical protein [Chlorobium sp.]
MNFMHEIIETVADELSVKLGRSAEGIRQNGLSRYDFTSNEVEILFEDGSSAKFKYSFYVECSRKSLIAVFTEHCGYHLFSSLGAMVRAVPQTRVEIDKGMNSKSWGDFFSRPANIPKEFLPEINDVDINNK